MAKKPLIFVGSRQSMTDLAFIAELNDIEVLGILDHHYYGNTDEISGIPIIGDERLLDTNDKGTQLLLQSCDFFPGNWHSGEQHNTGLKLRLDRINLLDRVGANVINLIHPDASVLRKKSRFARVNIGKGVQMHVGATCSANNVTIGDYSGFADCALIGHNSTIGRNVLVGPRTVLYDTVIKDNVFVGALAHTDRHLRRGVVTIGENSTVWIRSRVGKDIPANSYHTTDGRIFSKKGSVL